MSLICTECGAGIAKFLAELAEDERLLREQIVMLQEKVSNSAAQKVTISDSGVPWVFAGLWFGVSVLWPGVIVVGEGSGFFPAVYITVACFAVFLVYLIRDNRKHSQGLAHNKQLDEEIKRVKEQIERLENQLAHSGESVSLE